MDTNHPPIQTFTNNPIDFPQNLIDGASPEADRCFRVTQPRDKNGGGGDRPISWNSKDQLQVAAAKILFERMLGEGMVAYPLRNGVRGTSRMSSFDPTVEDVVFVDMEAMAGG